MKTLVLAVNQLVLKVRQSLLEEKRLGRDVSKFAVEEFGELSVTILVRGEFMKLV